MMDLPADESRLAGLQHTLASECTYLTDNYLKPLLMFLKEDELVIREYALTGKIEPYFSFEELESLNNVNSFNMYILTPADHKLVEKYSVLEAPDPAFTLARKTQFWITRREVLLTNISAFKNRHAKTSAIIKGLTKVQEKMNRYIPVVL